MSRIGRGATWRLVLLALLLAPANLLGQQARGWIGSTAQLVGMRPVESLGQPCPAGEPCYTTLDPQLAAVATQDLFLTAWGFGLQGLSATVQVRSRQDLGGAFPWPRADDAFDAILAYASLSRRSVTVRLGRQEIRSGLGFPSFDGALLRWSHRTLRVEAYAGRSLAQGLREPTDEALRGLDTFLPDQSATLFGGSARGLFGGVAATARYQRELLSDRSGLASERASLDLSTTLPWVTVRSALDYDFGRGAIGKGHMTVGRAFADGRWMTELSAARYVPYFSLSTIWGFFEPVAYHEGLLRVRWASAQAWSLHASLGARRYGDAGATLVLRPLDQVGRRVGVEARWRPTGLWQAGASYDLEWGPGGYLSSVEGRLAWTPSDRTHLAVTARSFQQIEQYRLGDGRALGAGMTGGTALLGRLSLSGGVSVLRHRTEGVTEDSPWNQFRAWTSVRVEVGDDPGRSSRRRGP